MRLTKKKAIELSIELWTFMSETGSKLKGDWSGWKIYGLADARCFLCEYGVRHENLNKDKCDFCPYCDKFQHCLGGAYGNWYFACGIKDRKKYATQFLEQLKQL